jgi:hypothetical protein
MRLPRSCRVLSAITTVSGLAMACKRAARFGVSPGEDPSPKYLATKPPLRSTSSVQQR